MMKKTIYYLLGMFAFITCITDVQAVASWNVESGIASTGSTSGGESWKDGTLENGNQWSDGNVTKKYQCRYKTGLNNPTDYKVSIYDIEDNEILNKNFTIDKEKLPLSGTSIGINIHEQKNISFNVEVKLTVTKTETTSIPQYICKYGNKISSKPLPGLPSVGLNSIMTLYRVQQIALICKTTQKDANADGTCPNPDQSCKFLRREQDGYKSGTVQSTYTLELNSNITNKEDRPYFEDCKKYAIEKAVEQANGNITASYSLEITDSNDINGSDSVVITHEDANKTMSCQGRNGCIFQNNGQLTDSMTINMYYKKDRTCINVKTAKVTYKEANEQCDPITEVEVSNTKVGDLEHWHYFIPLNAKSIDQIKVKMSPVSNEPLSKDRCLYVMRNNPIKKTGPNENLTYVQLIKPVETGKEFNGDYICNENCDPKTGDWNEVKSRDYNYIQNNGCYLTSNAWIYSQQKFYNEVIEYNNTQITSRFNGFNFYYKAIEPNNDKTINIIFPNGVTTDENGDLTFNSLWSNWYKSQTTKGTASPNLSESYSKVTYIAQNINTSLIREYNRQHEYTDWSNMNVDGTSNFINNEDIIIRNNTLATDVYRLGCGPANIQYQKGCGIK